MKNLGQFKTTLQARLGNLDSADTFWTASNSGADYINKALNFVVLRTIRQDRRHFQLFRELRDRQPIQASELQSWVSLPANWIAVEHIYSYDTATGASQPNESIATKRRVEWIPEDEFEIRPRPASPKGYPNGWTHMADNLYITPTPGTGYATWMLAKGLRTCPKLTADGQTPILREFWETAIEDAAAYIAFKDMSWSEDAQAALNSLDQDIATTVDILGAEKASRTSRVVFKGMPRRS